MKVRLVGHVDIDADDLEHQFLAPSVETVALVECIAREQDRREGGRSPQIAPVDMPLKPPRGPISPLPDMIHYRVVKVAQIGSARELDIRRRR